MHLALITQSADIILQFVIQVFSVGIRMLCIIFRAVNKLLPEPDHD